MANRSYLVCCDFPDTCPAFRCPDIDPSRHVLGEAAYYIPLLWLAMFRRDDLRVSSVVDPRGKQFTDISPITTVDTARQQLSAAVPTLNHLFRKHGCLEGYVDAFQRLFNQPPGKYVTLELLEIAHMGDVADFSRCLKSGLEVFSQPAAGIGGLESAPLQAPRTLPPVPEGLRGKAAVSFLMEATGRDKKSVERTLDACRGDMNKALEFFKWQAEEAAIGKEEDAVNRHEWTTLAALAGLNLRRRWPPIDDVLAGRVDDRDDLRNLACLIGDGVLTRLATERIR